MLLQISKKSFINLSSLLKTFRREYSKVEVSDLICFIFHSWSKRDRAFANDFRDILNSSSLFMVCEILFCSWINLPNINNGLTENWPDICKKVLVLWWLQEGKIWLMIVVQSLVCRAAEYLNAVLSIIVRRENSLLGLCSSLMACPIN